MYITQVLFKRVLILLEFFCSDGLSLAADYYFKDSFSEFLACKFPLLCGMNMYPTVNIYFIHKKEMCNEVVGLNLHSSFAPVG